MNSETQHDQTVDELRAENQRLREELHIADAQLTAIRAIVRRNRR